MIAANSVLEEIKKLHEDRQTGVLALAGHGERVDIFFREGMIEAVSSSLGSHRLGDYLVKDGYVPARDLESVQSDAKKQKIVFGEAVVRKKLVDQAEIGAAVRSQTIGLLEHVLKNGFEVDSFTNCLRSYYVPARISFPHVLLELSRGNATLFEPEPGTEIALLPNADLSVFPWFPQELFVITELKQPRSFGGLMEATGLKETNLRRILGVLERLGVIETVQASEPAIQHNIVVRNAGLAFEHLIPIVTNAVLNEKLEAARNESSFTSEQFRNLKVLLTQAKSETPLKIFTVSSPDAQAGKSLVSVNLAFSFARDPGRRVLLIDCDLRNPAVDRYLGVPSNPGLIQYLENGRLGPYCFVRRLENLYFMTAGGVAPNPIEVLSMKKMKQLVEYLRADFDTIILDAPPYAPIADARIVTALSDGLLMVVRRGKTTYSSTDRTFKAVDHNKLMGVVFNDVKPMLFNTYHGPGYYQYGSDKVVYSGSNGSKPRNTVKNYLEP